MTEEQSQNLITSLNQLLADTAVFKQKAQAYHWTVRGLLFHSLHEFFGDIYEETEEAFDEIAEQVRVLGDDPNLQLSQYVDQSVIEEANPTENPSAVEMLRRLYEENEKIIAVLKEIEQIAEEADAESVLDFAVERHRQHDMYRYKLRSHIETNDDTPTTQ